MANTHAQISDGALATPALFNGLFDAAWKGDIYNVKRFGAVGDNSTDDTASIQSAIDTASADGGGTVYLPPGTFRLSSKDTTLANCLTPKSNVLVRGAGGGTIITVPNGFGEFDIFRSTNSVSNFGLADFVYDGNGSNNTASSLDHSNGLLEIPTGAFITVVGVRARNVAGQRIITLGSASTTPTVTGAKIANCEFDTVADTISGNLAQTDHSTVFVVANSVEVTGNRFRNPSVSTTATAVEIHGSGVLVADNNIDGFNIGVIGPAWFCDARGVAFSDNVMRNIRSAYRVSARSNQQCEVSINGGSLKQANDTYAIVDLDYCTTPANAVVVRNVEMECTQTSPTNDSGYGIGLGAANYVEIAGNTFRNLSGRAISKGNGTGGGWTADAMTMVVDGNNFVNCGRTSYNDVTARYQVALYGANRILTGIFENNRFLASTSTTAEAIAANCGFGTFIWKNNTVVNVDDGLEFPSTMSVTYAEIVHSGTGDPESVVRGSVGCKWMDKSTGFEYTKRYVSTNTYGPDSIGWRKVSWTTGNSDPTGVYRQGDIAYRSDATAGERWATVCVVTGNPGQFKTVSVSA